MWPKIVEKLRAVEEVPAKIFCYWNNGMKFKHKIDASFEFTSQVYTLNLFLVLKLPCFMQV